MKNKKTLIALIVINACVYQTTQLRGQSSRRILDSLFTITKSKVHDSTIANAYTKIGEQYLLFNIDSALYYINIYDKLGKQIEKNTNSILKKKGTQLQAIAQLSRANCYYTISKNDLAIQAANDGIELYSSIKDDYGVATCNNTIGNVHLNLGKLDVAENYFKSNYNNREKLGITKIVAAACNNLGLIASKRSDFKSATTYYLESLKIKDSLGDTKAVAKTYNNLGLLHAQQDDGKNALRYYEKALEIDIAINDKKGEGVAYNNIGNLYFQLDKNYEKAIETHEKALKIRQEIGDKHGIGSSLNNLGTIYNILADSAKRNNNQSELNKYLQLSGEYLTNALKMRREINDLNGIASALNNLGSLMILRGKVDAGIAYCKEAYEIGKKINVPDREDASCQCLQVGYLNKKDYKNAYTYFNRHIAIRDSFQNEKNKEDLISKTLEYEYEKKSLADSLRNSEQRKLDVLLFEKEQDKQKYFTISAVLVSLLMFILFAVTFKNYRNKKKINDTLSHQNKIITEQKEIVESKNIAINQQKEVIEEKNREIVDSIQYAKRIQDAILPDTKLLDDFFTESFILFKPKDIVSGDFYWAEKKKDTLYLSVVDCTGHGVPGAFISLLGYNLLNRSINEFGCKSPSEILTCMDEKLEDLLKRSSITVRDGMDLALCSFSKKGAKKIMCFSGAHNPCWIVREKSKKQIGKTVLDFGNYQLCELNSNRQSIGGFTDKNPYFQEEVELEKGDTIYLFSDGYADQFGGNNGKKFKYGKLRELLLSIYPTSLSEQNERLNRTIEDWKGEHTQVDDICIIGLRV